MTEIEEEVDAYPPWNFSWVVEDELAAMAWPQTKENLQFIYEEGVRHLITLSPEKTPPMDQFQQLEWTEIPITEFEAPTIKDIVKFIDTCERCQLKKQPVGVHSRMGKDRTGVMVACFLARFRGLDADSALAELRAKRPRSIEEEPELEAVIGQYCRSLKDISTSNAKSGG